MSDYRHKRHNVSSLLYHIVCPAKYRRVIFDAEVDMVLKEICLDIAKRYELAFLEIGTDNDHVHFLVQSVPSYRPTKIVQIIKSLTAREIFHRVPTVKKRLWGGEFWSKGYFISTVGRHGNEEVIRAYVRQQGSEKAYTQLHRQDVQVGLFYSELTSCSRNTNHHAALHAFAIFTFTVCSTWFVMTRNRSACCS